MTIQEGFRMGFAERLAELGLEPGDVDAMLKKAALLKKEAAGFFGEALDATKDMGSALGTGVVNTAMVGIPVGSAMLGWGLGGTQRVSKEDLQAMEQTALVKEYKDVIRRLQRENKMKQPVKRKSRPAHSPAVPENSALKLAMLLKKSVLAQADPGTQSQPLPPVGSTTKQRLPDVPIPQSVVQVAPKASPSLKLAMLLKKAVVTSNVPSAAIPPTQDARPTAADKPADLIAKAKARVNTVKPIASGAPADKGLLTSFGTQLKK